MNTTLTNKQASAYRELLMAGISIMLTEHGNEHRKSRNYGEDSSDEDMERASAAGLRALRIGAQIHMLRGANCVLGGERVAGLVSESDDSSIRISATAEHDWEVFAAAVVLAFNMVSHDEALADSLHIVAPTLRALTR